jgi:hypothetical protein
LGLLQSRTHCSDELLPGAGKVTNVSIPLEFGQAHRNGRFTGRAMLVKLNRIDSQSELVDPKRDQTNIKGFQVPGNVTVRLPAENVNVGQFGELRSGYLNPPAHNN